MEERRRYPRITVEGISGRMLCAEKAKVLNISLGGMAIEISKRLEINREYSLKLESKGDRFDFRGRVVWASLVGSLKGNRGDIIPVYHAGLKFVDLFNEKAQKLIEFIERHRMGESKFEDRIEGLRFKVKSLEGVIVDYPRNYKVKIISLGGMLIELQEAFEINRVFPMEIIIPGGLKIEVTGRIASCNQNEKNKDLYDTGIEFINMNPEDRNKLSDFLKSLGI
ncbi:MAG: PilZ domain-containing protein [Thermodesulfovibrionales bacterium]|nr:PilZ domain-containing protein [Thermodesulfovibrionales bacterium]